MAGTGPRCIYLKAVTDYTIDFDSRVFSVLGISTHTTLDNPAFTKEAVSEKRLNDEGTPDLLDPDEMSPGDWILNDYKTAGSYKVGLWLGLKEVWKDLVVNGKRVLWGSGNREGQQKKVREIVFNDKDREIKNEQLQLNKYRIMAEAEGYPISKMRLVAIPRDGGVQVAKERGLDRLAYSIWIPKLPDDKVNRYYNRLQEWVDEAYWKGYTRICTPHEMWKGRKCKGYCEVRDACKAMSKKMKADGIDENYNGYS